jgi:type I restriction enzyme, S subunit
VSPALDTVPEGWSLLALTSLSAQYKGAMTDGPFGSNLKSAHYTESGPRVIRLQNIGDGVFLEADAHISPEHYSTLIKHAVESGDVLIAILGEVLPRACLAPPSIAPAIVKADCIRFRPDPNRALAKYVCFALNAEPTRRRAAAIVHGVGRPRLNLGELRELKIPVAPIDVQQRIVEAVDTHFSRIDAGVAALKRVQANLKRYRASVLQAACEGRLVPTEAELARRESRDYEPASVLLQRILKERRREWEAFELAKLKAKGRLPIDDRWKGKYNAVEAPTASENGAPPEGWVLVRLADIAEVRLGRQRSPERAIGPHMCPYMRAANVTWAGIDTSDVKEMDFTPAERKIYRLQKGDILMSEASGSVSEVGKPAIWNEEIGECCFQNTLLRVRAPGNLGKFIFWQLMADARLGKFEDHAPGVGIHHLGAERLSDWLIRLPPLSEQARIVAEIQRRLSLSAALEEATSRALERSERLRQSVLKDAFEGRLVPPSSLLAAGMERTAEIITKRDKRRVVTELSDV